MRIVFGRVLLMQVLRKQLCRPVVGVQMMVHWGYCQSNPLWNDQMATCREACRTLWRGTGSFLDVKCVAVVLEKTKIPKIPKIRTLRALSL
jgi:hypothetical protein